MTQTALQPVNTATVAEAEKENEAPWVVRKLVGVCPPLSLSIQYVDVMDMTVHDRSYGDEFL